MIGDDQVKAVVTAEDPQRFFSALRFNDIVPHFCQHLGGTQASEFFVIDQQGSSGTWGGVPVDRLRSTFNHGLPIAKRQPEFDLGADTRPGIYLERAFELLG